MTDRLRKRIVLPAVLFALGVLFMLLPPADVSSEVLGLVELGNHVAAPGSTGLCAAPQRPIDGAKGTVDQYGDCQGFPESSCGGF